MTIFLHLLAGAVLVVLTVASICAAFYALAPAYGLRIKWHRVAFWLGVGCALFAFTGSMFAHWGFVVGR